jgi:SPP1 gp7 family putative phage head morphogenesis protein
MTPPIPDKLRSAILDHTVDLHRYSAGLERKIMAMVDSLGKELSALLMDSGIDTPRTAWRKARLSDLLKEAEKTIQEGYGGISSAAKDELSGMVQVTSKALTTACNDAFGAGLMVPVKWTKEMLESIAGDTLIQGAPSAEWWSRQASGLSDAFADQMRQGMLRGETLTQLRDRIMGQGIPGVNAVGKKVDLRKVQPQLRAPVWTARRNAEALVRTSVITTANAAHEALYAANADIMDGLSWCSTLDYRTCPSCGALDGKTWTFGETHPSPSLHWGCRCTILPKTKSWEDLAREAHGNSRLAKELDKMAPGDRASMGGPVSGSLTYQDWFDELPAARQEEILGPGKLALYRKGKLGFTDLIDQRGNPLTLEELKAMTA